MSSAAQSIFLLGLIEIDPSLENPSGCSNKLLYEEDAIFVIPGPRYFTVLGILVVVSIVPMLVSGVPDPFKNKLLLTPILKVEDEELMANVLRVKVILEPSVIVPVYPELIMILEAVRLAFIVAPFWQSVSNMTASPATGTDAPVLVLQALFIVDDQLAVVLVLAPLVGPTQYLFAA